tara:strand:- start:4788 stop:5234 length:447 start_codon:yes stop_codon:yes gene_type:complete
MFLKMKNIYLIILSFICFYSHSQFEATEGNQRWEVLGSKKDGTVFLKLQGSNFYKFSFKNYQFSDNKTINSIDLNSSDIDIRNLYSFLMNSFNLSESSQSSFKIDKYEFQVLKNGDFIRLIIKSVNLNETIGWMPLSIQDLNNLFGKN